MSGIKRTYISGYDCSVSQMPPANSTERDTWMKKHYKVISRPGHWRNETALELAKRHGIHHPRIDRREYYI